MKKRIITYCRGDAAATRLATFLLVVICGILVSALVVSILTGSIAWVTQFGTLSLFAGKFGAMNSAFLDPGFHWTPFTGKLGPRVRLAFSLVPYFNSEHGHSSLIIPLTGVFILALSVTIALNRQIFRRRRTGFCVKCGYDVRGITTCPECGLSILAAANRHAWIAPVIRVFVFLLFSAIVPVLVTSMWSSIAYDGKNLTVFLSEFTVGLIWPEGGSRQWENEGLRINSFGSTSLTQMLGISWPSVYLNEAEMTRVVRVPIWFCFAVVALMYLIVKRIRRIRITIPNPVQAKDTDGVPPENNGDILAL